MIVGEILPVALAVAISPMPIMAVILMIMSERGRSTAVAFLVGWVIGLSVVVTAATLLIGPATTPGQQTPSPVVSVLKIALGLVLLFLALRQWRGRPQEGEDHESPAWMAKINRLTGGKAFGVGAFLSGLNPKNLALCMAGGVSIGSANSTAGEAAITIGVFVVIASCTVAAPVIAYLVAQEKVRQPLDELRVWLSVHSAAVMTVLLLITGVMLLGKGLSGFGI